MEACVRITLEGWGRNHGEKVIFAKGLEASRYSPVSGSINIAQYELTTHDVRVKGQDKVRVGVRFGVENLRTGGDYQTKITFGQEDLALLFVLAFRHEPLERVMDVIASARAGLADDEDDDEQAAA